MLHKQHPLLVITQCICLIFLLLKIKPVEEIIKKFNYQVWYDENYKYLRYDSRPLRPTNQFYTTNPITEIQDFNTGM